MFLVIKLGFSIRQITMIPVTASGEQLTIKGKGNIDLFVGDIVLKLLDTLYVPGLTVNFISIAKL